MTDLRLYIGDVRQQLRRLPESSIHCVATSPPYWGLRAYGTPPVVWGENDPTCEHVWGDWQARHVERHTVTLNGKSRMTERCYGGDASRRFDGNHQKHVAGQWCQMCGAWRGELGNEPSLALYISNLVEVFREVWRVLHPSGLLFVNLGDSYARNPTKGQHRPGQNGRCTSRAFEEGAGRSGAVPCDELGLKEKDLCLVPSRLAIAMVEDGWWLRNDCIWTKPNAKPSSVTDRFVDDYEHVFMFARSSRYHFDWMAIAEPHKTSEADQRRHKKLSTRDQAHARAVGQVTHSMRDSHGGLGFGEVGRRCRTTWSFTTKSYPNAHFAVFAPELPERCLRAATSQGGCCARCGMPRVRVVVKGEPDRAWQARSGGDAEGAYTGSATKDFAAAGAEDASAVKARILAGMAPKHTLGFRFACKCHGTPRSEFPRTADARKRHRQDMTGDWRFRVAVALTPRPGTTEPCRALDIFVGSGTTLAVAHQLGLDATGIELQAEYSALCVERVAKVGGVLEVIRPSPLDVDRLPRLLPEPDWSDLEPVEEESSGWHDDSAFAGFAWEGKEEVDGC